MSGGRFDYKNYHIDNIIEEIQCELDRQGTEKPKSELYMGSDYYKSYPDEKKYTTYSNKTQEEFKKAIEIFKKASIYAKRIDWFLSGDDSEETFHDRLNNSLNEIDNGKS